MSEYVQGIVRTLTRTKGGSINVYIVNENVLKDLKKICQVGDDFVTQAFLCLLEDLSFNSPIVRLRALGIIDVLFVRSKSFRALACDSLQRICGFCGLVSVKNCNFNSLVGNIYKKVLPYRCLHIVRSWSSKFGNNYPQLLVFISYYNKNYKRTFERDEESNKSLEELEQIISNFSLSYSTISFAIKNILEDYNSYVLTQNLIRDYAIYSERQANFLDYSKKGNENSERYRKFAATAQPNSLMQTLDSLLYDLPDGDESENVQPKQGGGSSYLERVTGTGGGGDSADERNVVGIDGSSSTILGAKRKYFQDDTEISPSCNSTASSLSSASSSSSSLKATIDTRTGAQKEEADFESPSNSDLIGYIDMDDEDWIEDFEMGEVSAIHNAFDLSAGNAENFNYNRVGNNIQLEEIRQGGVGGGSFDSSDNLAPVSEKPKSNVDLNDKRFEIFQFNFDIEFVRQCTVDLYKSLISKAIPFLRRWKETCEKIQKMRVKGDKNNKASKNKVFTSITQILNQAKHLIRLIETLNG